MYGLVNRAIEQLVVSVGGAAAWQRVRARAGTGAEGFVTMHLYPDELTHRLVAAVGDELELSPTQVLEAFGEYWILYTAQAGYGHLLEAGGKDLRSFLANLDALHGGVEAVFPLMQLPLFRVEELGPDRFELYYASEREGLTPMVVGLVRGLARRFGQRIELQHRQRRSATCGEDVFVIRELPPLGAAR